MPDAQAHYGLEWKNNATLKVPIGEKNDKIIYKYVVLAGY
jgi:hypothetical protein